MTTPTVVLRNRSISHVQTFTKVEPGPAFVVSHGAAADLWARLRAFDDRSLRDYLEDCYPTEMLVRMDELSAARDSSLRPVTMPRVTPLAYEDLTRALRTEGQIDVLVGSRRNRRDSSLVKCHVWHGPLPDGLLVKLARHIYVCAPELVFLQMANQLEPLALQEFAYELCSSYVRMESGAGPLYDDVRPLTTPLRLRAAVRIAGGIRGLDAARQAAEHVHARSRSPRESQLAILLGFPRRRGGFGCGPLEMDHRIELSDDAQAVSGRDHLVADIYVPAAKTDIEYQVGHHQGSANRARDDARTNALALVGVREHRIWGEQLYDERFMSGVSRLIRKHAGLRDEPLGASSLEKRRQLIEKLRGSSTGSN